MSERDVLADIFENEDHMGDRPYDLADALIRHLNKRGLMVCDQRIEIGQLVPEELDVLIRDYNAFGIPPSITVAHQGQPLFAEYCELNPSDYVPVEGETAFGAAEAVVTLSNERNELRAERDELAAIVQEAASNGITWDGQEGHYYCELCGDCAATIEGIDADHGCAVGRARVWQEQQNHTNNSPQQETPNQ